MWKLQTRNSDTSDIEYYCMGKTWEDALTLESMHIETSYFHGYLLFKIRMKDEHSLFSITLFAIFCFNFL